MKNRHSKALLNRGWICGFSLEKVHLLPYGAYPSYHTVRGGYSLDRLPVCRRTGTETDNL